MAKKKGKQAGKGRNLLELAGALGLMFVAWRFPIPLPWTFHPTTLLSMTAILLGMFMGWKRGALVGLLYVLAVLLELPPMLWHMSSGGVEAFMDIRTNGYVLGLIPAAFVGGRLAPQANCSYGRLLATLLIGHAVYLLCGTAWLMRLEPLRPAIAEGVTAQAVPVVAKSALGFVIAAVIRRFI